MIEIDPSRLAYLLPKGWLSKAAELQADLDGAAGPEEAAEILKNNRHWGKLNQMLSSASNHKCWYSESRHAAARMDVDHFRPKGRVRESDGSTRPGYPFLAYELRNYRLSAQLMNQRTRDGKTSRGKHDQFPLASGTPPAGDRAGLADEKPLLLDPTVPGDPGLLTFDERGQALAAVGVEDDPNGRERAERTIDVLWLDHRALADNRKVAWRRAHEAIRRADRFAENARRHAAEGEHAEAATEWGLYRDELRSLRAGAKPREEFSAVVRACLRTSGRGWALRIAERAARSPLRIEPVPVPPSA